MIDQQNETTLSTHTISRREVLRGLSAIGAAGAIGGVSRAEALSSFASSAAPGKAFPAKFLWGAATAAHQVEGNNVNSDLWTLEHLQNSMFKEPSGDACDHYHLYEEDIARLAGLGFNTYRFSIEWARIEPDEGFFSMAELEHYRRMLVTCHEHKLVPLVTYYHYSLPRWLALSGGWENPRAPELYARYEDYRKKRSVFNEKFKYEGRKRQKYYVRGEDSLGNKAEHHKTDWKIKPFVSNLSPLAEHNVPEV